MSDNVNIIVQDTINDIVVNTAVVVETIDINVQVAVDEVNIIANPNNYVVNINRIIGEQVQSDWDQNDDQEPDYIKNKPSIPSIAGLATVVYVDQQDNLKVDKVAGKGLSENDFTNTLKTKLDGIESGAQVNVNADWNATTGDAEILNKPTIPAAVTNTSELINDGEDGVNPFITAADLPTSVTSVGLTMPSAFNVANSPITSAGTLAVTGAGVVSQYVRGDGSLANFPTSTGGGASVSYYLNGSVSQGTIGGVAYKEINGVPVIGTGTDFTINADGYIAQFITDVGDPNKLLIPAGNWNFETYFSASSNGGSPRFYIELYKYNGATFTLIATNSATPENITGGTSIDLYLTALAIPPTTLLATDRLAVRFYVIHSGRTITMHTENSHLSQIITTFSTGLTALNGLTTQVQSFATGTSGTDFGISSATSTHTFNLPTASATNRGALSTTDWSAFNGKQNALTNPITGTGTTNYLPKFTGASALGNSLIFDNGTNVGIGTAVPAVALDIYGTGTVQSRIVSASGGDIRFSVDTLGRMGTYSNSSLSLLTNSVARLLIDTAGNVGIGTSTPSSKLQVNDTTAFSYSAGPNVSAKIGASGTGGSFLVNTPSANSSYESGLAIDGTYTGGKSVININAFGVYSGGPYSADLAFKTSTTTTLSEKMRITNAGNVGIGTTAPTARLHVAAPGALSTDIALRVRNSADTTDLFQVQGNGAIVMSSGASFYSLGNALNFRSNLAGGSGFVLDVQSFNSLNSTNNEQGFGFFSGTFAPTSGTGTLNGLKITPTINQTGGANGITRGLFINPTLTAAANFRAIETTVGNVILGSTSGNVGIGTTAPTSKLQVVGLVDYATNALAIAGGLTVGAFYHTAGVVKVVI